MAIKAFKRYEKKFLIDKDKYDELIEVLLQYMDYDDYCKDGQNYNIYNLY
ncbi:molecular chaperone, partial [Clostridium saudiense]|nr:molecular chaperone [Clostridium saudiense]